MTLDLVPRRLLSFPSIPSIWDEGDDWLSSPSTQTGLTVSEDDNNVYVEAAVPGIDPDKIEATYQDGYVWIRGQEEAEEKDSTRKYFRQASRSYSYRVAVPGEVDQNGEPEASYKNGIMLITFAKSPKSQPKKIRVKQLDSANKK